MVYHYQTQWIGSKFNILYIKTEQQTEKFYSVGYSDGWKWSHTIINHMKNGKIGNSLEPSESRKLMTSLSIHLNHIILNRMKNSLNHKCNASYFKHIHLYIDQSSQIETHIHTKFTNWVISYTNFMHFVSFCLFRVNPIHLTIYEWRFILTNASMS